MRGTQEIENHRYSMRNIALKWASTNYLNLFILTSNFEIGLKENLCSYIAWGSLRSTKTSPFTTALIELLSDKKKIIDVEEKHVACLVT